MKKVIALALAVVMLVSVVCCLGLSASADKPEAEMFWLTHYGNNTVEGAGSIFTETYSGAAWWLHVAFKPVAGTENAWEVVEICNGLPDGTATPLAIPENGFVWAANYGNDYPALNMGDTDFTSPNCSAAIGRATAWKVGDQFVITGLDLKGKTVPTTTPEINWYDDAYVCTATIAPLNAKEEEPAGPLTAKVTKGALDFDKSKLGLLIDGVDAADATAFSDERLVSFKNTGFNHNDGVAAAAEATLELNYDLGELKPVNGISLSFYYEAISMVDLPIDLQFYISKDGVNFYQANAGASVAAPADATDGKVYTLKADFSTRGTYNTRYIKAVATLKNGWFFISELGYTTTDAAYTCDPEGPYACTMHATVNPGIGVFNCNDGEIDLTQNTDGVHFKNSQIIIAEWNPIKDYYVIKSNKVNPWPDGHTGTVLLAENEILLSIVTGGAYGEDKTADNFTNCKWIARGLAEGDIIVLNDDDTLNFYKPEQFANDPETSEDESETEIDNYQHEIAQKVGEENEDAKFALNLDAKIGEDGKTVTLTVNVDDIEGQLSIIMANICFDAERLTLTTAKDKDGIIQFTAKGFNDNWENELTHMEEDGEIIFSYMNPRLEELMDGKGDYSIEFTFELKEGFDEAGFWIASESVEGADETMLGTVVGNGSYAVAKAAKEEPSEEPSAEPSKDESKEESKKDESKDVGAGDTGIIVFAVLGILAIAGAATVIKVRR